MGVLFICEESSQGILPNTHQGFKRTEDFVLV